MAAPAIEDAFVCHMAQVADCTLPLAGSDRKGTVMLQMARIPSKHASVLMYHMIGPGEWRCDLLHFIWAYAVHLPNAEQVCVPAGGLSVKVFISQSGGGPAHLQGVDVDFCRRAAISVMVPKAPGQGSLHTCENQPVPQLCHHVHLALSITSRFALAVLNNAPEPAQVHKEQVPVGQPYEEC